jgi:hypothetical protein
MIKKIGRPKNKIQRIKDSITWDPELKKKFEEFKEKRKWTKNVALDHIVETFFNGNEDDKN